MSVPEPLAAVVPLERRRGVAEALWVALRPRQWTKNLLLLAGIVFAAELADPGRWARALTAFTVYCAASSAAYLVNDLRDARADRLHPVKRRRPLARGELTPRFTLGAAAALAAVAIAGAALLGWTALGFLLAFLALQGAYTLRLKRLVLIDVMTIAGLFVIRAAAGADAVDVRISPWLLVCTALLALFLALGKRRGELLGSGVDAAPARTALEGYSLALVDQLVTIVASATVVSYAVYALTAHDTYALAATIPFVVFGVFRYLLLLHRETAGEEPENVLVSDVPILATVGLWSLTCAVILAVS